MNLLAIDSSHRVLSVSVSKADKIYSGEAQAGSKHSELVLDLIDSQIKKARLLPQDLDGVLCMGGPGSFTGLRIGFSIAKGLALSLSIPIAPVPTLDCMAFPCQNHSQLRHNCPVPRRCAPKIPRRAVLAVMEAGKNTFFYAFYRGNCLDPPYDQNADAPASLIDAEIARHGEKIILTGSGSSSLYNMLSPESKKKIKPVFRNRGYSSEIISIAKIRNLMYNDNSGFLYSGPEYIRKTDAELNLLNIGN